MNKKAFLLVGHSNWGKSFTLKELTGQSSKKRYALINKNDKKIAVFVRKMSNDDDSTGLLKWVQNRIIGKREIIMAFCPAFGENDKTRNTTEILDELKSKGFECYFFILESKYSGNEKLSKDEIAVLKKYGTIEVFEGKHDSSMRADTFKKFIEKYIA